MQFYLPSSISSVGKVPLSAVASVKAIRVPLQLDRFGPFPAAFVSFNLAPNTSLGDGINAIQKAEKDVALPAGMITRFQGVAFALQSALHNELLLVGAAVLAVYIVLGILYESFIHPVTILSTLPSAGVGALLALMLWRMDLDLIGIIGIVLLIGIVKKNAILMIDFALTAERQRGLQPREAIREACLLRLRPILMTTFAALFGAVPLMLGIGTGSELRHPLGVTIVGGLILSQLLTLFTTPVVYLCFSRFSAALSHPTQPLSQPAHLEPGR